MLDFFRRYQRYFFLVITVVIVISFSFFGTYSTLSSNSWREQIAFKAINGREVTRFDLDEMALFLATDNEDKLFYGGAWGPNFLNDGVIRKDFLETGIGQELALAYQEDLQSDMNKRTAKESKFSLYAHPQARFLNVESVWSYFAPEMKTYFETLKSSKDGLDPKAFDSRVKLYLAEKKLPASTLRYVLRYQEKQYSWLKPDDALNYTDLSLFGYHNLEDWFGSHYTKLVSQFIINAAILAEEKGYQVSKAEALADLVRHTQLSYQENLKNPHLGVTSAEEYFNEQLRRMNMDQARAIKIWRQILLFRRYFQDAGATALVDNLMSEKMHEFANENISLALYRLPSSLQFSSYDDWQKFEIYLHAVARQGKSDPLELPQEFLPVFDVAKQYPELVQKAYELEVAQVTHHHLQTRVPLRDLWSWEMEDGNWQLLAQQFPSLNIKKGESREERFNALENLDSTTRTIVDAFARQAIVKAHPEWIDQALSEAKPEKIIVGLRTQGGTMPFSGLKDKEKRLAFVELLDKALIGAPVAVDSPLYTFTADDQKYYRMTVLDRAKTPEILTFAEARSDGTIDEIRNRVLEKTYLAMREQNPLLYQKENKEWQPFESAKNSVADHFFKTTITALETFKKTMNSDQEKTWTKDQLASLRLYNHVNKIKDKLEYEPLLGEEWVIAAGTIPEKGKPLKNQWKIEKSVVTVNRQKPAESFDFTQASNVGLNEWSSVKTPTNGDLVFFQVKEKNVPDFQPISIAEKVRNAQSQLGAEAQRNLMQEVLKEFKSKEALSLKYLQIAPEENSSGSETID